jgi:WD40 repeat protein
LAVASKDALLSLWDIETGKATWTSKNVSNDELDLQVPIYDTDVCFYKPLNTKKQARSQLVTCTAEGELRLYDPSQSLKPT